MTTETPTDAVRIVYRGPSDEATLEVLRERQRNLEFFLGCAQELFEQNAGKFLLIHSGGEFVASADLLELIDLRETFDDVQCRASLIEVERTGVWML